MVSAFTIFVTHNTNIYVRTCNTCVAILLEKISCRWWSSLTGRSFPWGVSKQRRSGAHKAGSPGGVKEGTSVNQTERVNYALDHCPNRMYPTELAIIGRLVLLNPE
ncbi:hypothetical protein AVEN_62087-1 [Araneus ventricosus]|uniref:Uncharacterized protein n=1 Tax=Araneus ventricosus TaxID=182803 RepID=A0A4Y2W173_ARAVE|nr:hypothetical protein AVEN_62087-1 [Araneus ventricosus]